MRLWFVATVLTLSLIIVPCAAQNRADGVVEELAKAGFVNIRCAETDEYVVFSIENDTHKLQASGLAEAVRIIEDSGLTQKTLVKVIATKYQVPEVTLTYDASTENWLTTYRLDDSWKLVKNAPMTASSFGNVDLVIYPQLSLMNLIITQVYQALFQINPAVECSLWPGGKLTAQVNIPIYNDGYGETYGSFRPGYLTASQSFRLPENIFGRVTLGYFNSSRLGADLKLYHPLKNEQFGLNVGAQMLWTGYFTGFDHFYLDTKVDFAGNIGADFYWAKQNTKFSLNFLGALNHTHDFITGQKVREGSCWFKAEAIRYFRHVAVGLYALKGTRSDMLFNGGFQFVVSLPPYKYHRKGHTPRVTTGHFGMSYNANNEMYYYKEVRTEASDNMFNANEFNPYYIDSQIKKLNK